MKKYNNLQAQMKELFGNSCLGYSYARLIKQTDDAFILTSYFLEGWAEGFIEDDGYVTRPLGYLRLLGNGAKDVQKVEINKLSDLPDNREYVVEFKIKPDAKASHFVVATKDKVVFDAAGDSNTVKYGSPVSYRKLVY